MAENKMMSEVVKRYFDDLRNLEAFEAYSKYIKITVASTLPIGGANEMVQMHLTRHLPEAIELTGGHLRDRVAESKRALEAAEKAASEATLRGEVGPREAKIVRLKKHGGSDV